MDILYPIKKTESFNEELRYSFRSLQNISHNKVIIVGDLPSWVNQETVYYIPTEKLPNRYETTTNNIKCACQNKELSEDFILMNDDFFIMKPIKEKDLLLNRGLMKDVVHYYHKVRHCLTNYDRNVEKAMKELKDMGFENPISFELHTPIILNKEKFLSIVGKITTESLHTCKRSVYGNYFIADSKTIEDVKILSHFNISTFDFDNKSLLSASEGSWPKIRNIIAQKFPKKCIYEL